jgi:hypothetical protein
MQIGKGRRRKSAPRKRKPDIEGVYRKFSEKLFGKDTAANRGAFKKAGDLRAPTF